MTERNYAMGAAETAPPSPAKRRKAVLTVLDRCPDGADEVLDMLGLLDTARELIRARKAREGTPGPSAANDTGVVPIEAQRPVQPQEPASAGLPAQCTRGRHPIRGEQDVYRPPQQPHTWRCRGCINDGQARRRAERRAQRREEAR